MNPPKNTRREKDPNRPEISRSFENAKEKKNYVNIFSSNKSKDKVSPHIPEEEKKSHAKIKEAAKNRRRSGIWIVNRIEREKISRYRHQKKRNLLDPMKNWEILAPQENNIPFSAELTPTSVGYLE
jgi:hypothetical protein